MHFIGQAVAAVRPELAPDQSKYDPTDERLRDAAALLQEALNSDKVEVCFLGYRAERRNVVSENEAVE